MILTIFIQVLNDGGWDGVEGEQGSEAWWGGGGEQGGFAWRYQEHVRSGRQGRHRPTRLLQSLLQAEYFYWILYIIFTPVLNDDIFKV